MFLEQLAWLYNQAMRNAQIPIAPEEDRNRWLMRANQLLPLLEVEMKHAEGRTTWVNGYAIVYPDSETKKMVVM